MTTFRPGVIRTLDYTDPYGDGDHDDHHNAAYYTYEAQQGYPTPHRLEEFRGYPVGRLPANQPDAVAGRKLATFLAYSAHDSHTCQTAMACGQDSRYWSWMSRTYQVSGPPARAVSTAPPPHLPVRLTEPTGRPPMVSSSAWRQAEARLHW